MYDFFYEFFVSLHLLFHVRRIDRAFSVIFLFLCIFYCNRSPLTCDMICGLFCWLFCNQFDCFTSNFYFSLFSVYQTSSQFQPFPVFIHLNLSYCNYHLILHCLQVWTDIFFFYFTELFLYIFEHSQLFCPNLLHIWLF